MHSFWRAARWGFWLGWQMETNWAQRWVFVLHMLIKPITGTLLFVCMFRAARSLNPEAPLHQMAFTFLGSAFFLFAGAIGFGMATALVVDREQYGMLKYTRLCPVSMQAFLLGRGLANGARGMFGAFFTVVVGLLLPIGLRDIIDVRAIHGGWLIFHLAVGTLLLLGVGLMLAAAVLNMARHGMFLSEGVGSALFLVSGALFPIRVLPPWLQTVSLSLPHSYWMEGLRKAILPTVAASDPGPLQAWTQPALAAVVLASSVGVFLLGQMLFRAAEERALRLGRYEYTTGY